MQHLLKPDHICSLDAQVEASDMAIKKTNNGTDIPHIAKVIRKELTEQSHWKFSGTFQ